MESTKNTPSPWAWQRFGDTYNLTAQHGMREIIIGGIKHGSMGYPVVGMNNDGRLVDVDPEFPNAKLIAAAPELLETLKELLKEYTETDFDFVGLNPKLIEKTKALIARL